MTYLNANTRRTFRLTTLILTAMMTLILGLIVLTLFSGCGTNAPTKAAQGEQVLISTVNAGVSQIVAAINAGKLTQKQCDQFKTAYITYYDAQQALRAVIENLNVASGANSAADLQSAQNSAVMAEQALIATINSLLPH